MKRTLIYNILVIFCEVTYGHLIHRNYIFYKEAGGWLIFHLNRLKWEEAVLKCHSEAILASPLNANISKAITSVMCAAPVFTGISNVYSRIEYQSMEGVPLSHICLSWPGAVEPDVNDKETNCIALDANGVATVVPCSRRLPFVCYRKELHKLNDCDTADPKYVLDKRTGSCYKGYTEPLSWTEAYERCAMDGAHLTIINSRTEAKVIYELAKRVSPENFYVSIGFRAWGNRSTWLTIHGQSLKDAGYANWAPKSLNKPGNYGGIEFCGSVYTGKKSKFEDGILSNLLCNKSGENPFICEKKTNFDTNTNN